MKNSRKYRYMRIQQNVRPTDISVNKGNDESYLSSELLAGITTDMVYAMFGI